MEEGELDPTIFPLEEANSSILFVHTVLRDSSPHYVCSGSRVACLGHLLCPCLHVLPQHPPGPKIVPVHRSLSPLREHNVSD